MASSSSSLLSSSPLTTSPSPTSPPDSPRLALPAPSPPTFPHFGSAVPIILWDIRDNAFHTFNEDPPEYITLSHGYKEDAEENIEDLRLDFITFVAKEHCISHVWLDPHCMGQTQDEISRSVESMFKYYQGARFCCVWLRGLSIWDVWNQSCHPCFTESWLLQDLLASTCIQVYAWERSFIGQITKTTTQESREDPEDRILYRLANSMRLPFAILSYPWPEIHSHYTVAQKMSWAAGRTTHYPEDKAYSLLGILDVNIPVIYPDQNAFRELQQHVVSRHPKDQSIFAWALGSWPSTITGGLWARSPDEFAGCNGVFFKDESPGVDGSLMQLTPQHTLFLSAPIVMSESDSQSHPYVLLNCVVQVLNGKYVSIGIPLCQNGDKEYCRPGGVAPGPLPFPLPPHPRYLHNIEITPSAGLHGKRRFSLAFDPGLGDIQHWFSAIDPIPRYQLVHNKENDHIWHFESYPGLEAPTQEIHHIQVGKSSLSMEFLAVKLELSWGLRTCHWDITA
ncbi:vegetative incompatibility protein het-e-1 [Colletotrichum kahawae]|uniref:Vegetative incompatibility protein het-e-1 n=1 Tax=Colletotrichum kahawae TaxID=34407 RepID=A0AAD9Y400_COLKA|nr:vegetative incompatibility protein het-e-1 [Colletotrichum kahawae]